MAEPPLRYLAAPPREEMLRALCRPHAFDPPLRILARDVLGADSRIDLVGVDPSGRLLLVLLGDGPSDPGLLTRGLAQRAWVQPRVRDWLQLAPGLEVSASAPVVAALLAPGFPPETRAAAEAVGPGAVELWSCRGVRNGADLVVLLERLSAPPEPPGAAPCHPLPIETAPFRSGLSDEDLGLTPDELAEFSNTDR